jgi:hypothetical protein
MVDWTRRKFLVGAGLIAGAGALHQGGFIDDNAMPTGKIPWATNSDAVNDPIISAYKFKVVDSVIGDKIPSVSLAVEGINKDDKNFASVLKSEDPTKKGVFILSNRMKQSVVLSGRQNVVDIMNIDLGHKTITSDKAWVGKDPYNQLNLDSRILAMYPKTVVQEEADGSIVLKFLRDGQPPNSDTPTIRIEGQTNLKGQTVTTFGIVKPDGNVEPSYAGKLESLDAWRAALKEAVRYSVEVNRNKNEGLASKPVNYQTNTMAELEYNLNQQSKDLAQKLVAARKAKAPAPVAAEGEKKEGPLPEEKAIAEFNEEKRAQLEAQIKRDEAHIAQTARIAYTAMAQGGHVDKAIETQARKPPAAGEKADKKSPDGKAPTETVPQALPGKKGFER